MWASDLILGAALLGALGLVAWLIHTTTTQQADLTRASTRAIGEMSRVMAETVTELVLGRPQDSPPSTEASSTEPPEKEQSKRDEWRLEDMPPHIQEIYRREAEEDSLREMLQQQLSMQRNGSSTETTHQT